MAKRIGFIMPELCENDNIYQGYLKSKHGKTYVHNMLTNKEFNPEKVLAQLQYDFLNGTYKTSNYSVFKIYEPKERIIYRLPYVPDRIAHHCIMNVMEEFWTNKIPNTSYSCIKGRGVSGAYRYLKKVLKDEENTKYCLKADVKKFFPNVNHRILKQVITRYIKDYEFLNILYEIIDSIDSFVNSTNIGRKGYNLPIGNYLSQYFANLIIAQVVIKLRKKFPKLYIIVYMDDIVVLASTKEILHEFRKELIKALREVDLELKPNYQVFPVEIRGISFVGFIFYHKTIKLRKNIVYRIFRLCNKYINNRISKAQFKRSMASYYGWLKCADTKGLCIRIYNITEVWYSNFKGRRVKISTLKGCTIKICHVNKHKKYFVIEAIYHNSPVEIQSGSKTLLKTLLSERKSFTSNNIKNNILFTFK